MKIDKNYFNTSACYQRFKVFKRTSDDDKRRSITWRYLETSIMK